MTEEDIAYFRDLLHIKNAKFHGLQKFWNMAKMIEI